MATLNRREKLQHMGRKGGENSGRRSKYPFRAVVAHLDFTDELDCGHEVSASYAFGNESRRRYPGKRRCAKCWLDARAESESSR